MPHRMRLPMSTLWRPHDHHRGVRARLRADVAANPSQDRHIMSQTPRGRLDFLAPMRRPRQRRSLSTKSLISVASSAADGSPSRNCPWHAPQLPCVQDMRVAPR